MSIYHALLPALPVSPLLCKPKLHQTAPNDYHMSAEDAGGGGGGGWETQKPSKEHSSILKFNGLVIRVFSPSMEEK